MVNFLHTGRKLCLTTTVHDMYLSAETKCCSCSIHGYVAAADYSNLLACYDRGIIVLAEGFHQVVSG